MKFKFTSVLILILSFLNCSSNDNSETAVQKNFKFDVDGITADYSDGTSGTLYNDGTELRINGLPLTAGSVGEQLYLKIGEVTSNTTIAEGVYTIGNSNGFINENIVYRDGTSTGGFELYAPGIAYACNVLSDEVVGEINLTNLDAVNKLASGTFSGSLFLLNTNGDITTTEITNGVFTNIPLSIYNKDVDTNKVTATVDILNYVSDKVIGLRSDATGVDKIRLTSFDHNFGGFTISVLSDVSAGNSYTSDNPGYSDSTGVYFFNYLTRESLEVLGNSVVTITYHDTELNLIEGNFYLENASSTINNGEFSVTYDDLID